MALIQARVKLTGGNGKVYSKDSAVLNVNKNTSVLPNDLRSDKLLVFTSSMNVTKFYFVSGDKLLVEKTLTSANPSVVTLSEVVTVTKTGWLSLSEVAPAGFRESEATGTTTFINRYFIEPVEYAGDRYYSITNSLDRISSINFCKRLIFAASELAPAGIKDPYASMYFWGETNPATGVTELVIPATMDDISGLFDNAATMGAFSPNAPMPKIVTLGKIKKMQRTFYNAFAYGMFTYSPPVDAVVFGEMDVSEVTDFSYCFGQCFQANPDIENWNVSNATNMTGMFYIVVDWTADRWTRNLSKWCVSKITSEPTNFALNHPMTAAQKPRWGTCPSTARVSGYSVRNSPGGANDNYVAVFDNIGANDWIYISFSLLAVKKNDIISWGVPSGDYLNSNGNVNRATIHQLPSQAVVNGTNSIVFKQAASSALVTWRMDEAFKRSIGSRQGYIILYINGIEKLRITVFVLGDK